MQSLQGTFDAFDGATGSSRIEKALDEFFANSTDSRAALDGLLERAAALLTALVEGTSAVDEALRNSLPEPTAPLLLALQAPLVPPDGMGDRQ